MKKLALLLLIAFFTLASCEGDGSSTSSSTANEWKCGTYNGHQLYTGPKGGCYYYNSNGNKTYVDRSYCNCD